MKDYNEMNDSDVLCAVRVSLSGVPMPPPPRLEAIVARGRASRRRRHVELSVAGVASGAALVLGLSGVIGSARPAPARGSSQADLMAYSVVSNPNGTTTLTLNMPGGLSDPEAVRQALAQHGIPALVTVGEFCTTAVRPNAPDAITVQPPPPGGEAVGSPKFSPARPVGSEKRSIVFNPSAMPAGSEVSIGYRQDSNGRQISVGLIEAGAHLICSTKLNTNPAGGPS
jgi:hypothetical protein